MKIGIYEIIINKTTLSYFLKCKKHTESINPRVLKLIMIKQWYHQKVLYEVLKNQNLSKKIRSKWNAR